MGAWIPHAAGAVSYGGRVLMGSASFRARCLAIAGQLLIVAAGATTGGSLGVARVLTSPAVAHAFTAPSSVTEIISNNVSSGIQFGRRFQTLSRAGVDAM